MTIESTNLFEVKLNTLEIAKLTGKLHKNVIADVRKMLHALEVDGLTFQRIYLDAYKREKPMYELPEDLVNTLITGYSIKLRHAVVTELQIKHKALIEVQQAETVEEAKAISTEAMLATESRKYLRETNKGFNDLVTEAHKKGTIKAPSTGIACSNLNRLLNIAVNGEAPSKTKNETGLSPREKMLAEGNFTALMQTIQTQGMIEALISDGKNYADIKKALIG